MKNKIFSISFLSLACAIPIVVFVLPLIGFKHIVYKIDSYSPFWIFSLQLGLVLLLSVKLSKDFYKWLKELIPCPLSLAPVGLVIAFALALSIVLIEPRSRVQADESVHYIIAQNLYYNQIGQICSEGSFMENGFACVLTETVKTRGLSYIYMLGMPFFGKDLYWVHNLHLFFLAVALFCFYFGLRAWIGGALPILATSLLASCPILLFCFRSASVEPIYVTMFSVSLFLMKWVYDRNTIRHWILFALVLAFFAQTRSETVFCLLAFIWVAFIRNCQNQNSQNSQDLQNSNPESLFPNPLNYKFTLFLATLSFFSIPVLCTLSYMRDSDLQGGNFGAYGHLFSNIVSNFQVMALFHSTDDGVLKYPFLPYFTWFAIFGIIMLIILTIKEFRNNCQNQNSQNLQDLQNNSQFRIKYWHITAFILLLSPQYILLFNGVSADLTMTVQWRFALIILPTMAFLGALFLCKVGNIIYSLFSIIHSQLIPKIVLYGATIIILTTCLVQYRTFIEDIPNRYNFVAKEDYELNKWIRQEPQKRMLFFYWHVLFGLAHGHSAYSYYALLDLNSEDLNDILEDYKGEVYFVNSSNCDAIVGGPKMQAPNTFRICDRAIRYFETEEIFKKEILGHLKPFSIHKILGFNHKDSLGLLRILNKIESTDNMVSLHFKIPKERIEPWIVQHFVNDSLLLESPYIKDFYTDKYDFSIFNKDTNIWKLSIVDTITGEHIHSDFWELVRVR